ncbi:hypothetical protein C9I98_22200 [Photobacterium sanctipauli]|uniref:OmpR/PhoB-type domain-containing protein n=1 Tax=Photobacterium sanctipauli TaxID=1342794 RepID=A0A2T3NGM4_9GAMM|nr:winged helix-turn-helix domain-containing protein [Photobacterium sanctipauli]PSW13939.1 hypothetical protein C9I98_22200 [Photobacterium sanctipauli]
MKELIFLSDNVVFDTDERKLFKNDVQVKLNASEDRILQYFVDHHDEILTKAQLLSAGWPNGYVTESSLFGVILNLRNKLGKDVIITVPRLGYRVNITERKTVKKKRTGMYFLAGVLGGLLALAIALLFPRHGLEKDALNNDNALFALTTLSEESETFIKHLARRRSALNVYAVSYGELNSISWCVKDSHGLCDSSEDVTVQFYNKQLPEMLEHLAEGRLDAPLKTVSSYHGSSNYYSSYFVSFNRQLLEVELDMAYEKEDGEALALNVATLDTGDDFLLLAQSVSTMERKASSWIDNEKWLNVKPGFFHLNEDAINQYFDDSADHELLIDLTTKFVRTSGKVTSVARDGNSDLWLFSDGTLLWVHASPEAQSGILPFMN